MKRYLREDCHRLGWVTVTSASYMDYCAVACASLRRRATRAGGLPVVVVAVDKIEAGWQQWLRDEGCDLWSWQDFTGRVLRHDSSLALDRTDCPKLRSQMIKASVPLWSPFQVSCFVDADVIALGDMGEVWSYGTQERPAMAVEAPAPYSSYVRDPEWLLRKWGVCYSEVMGAGVPLYNSGVIVYRHGNIGLCRRWLSWLLRLTTKGWEEAVAVDDQLWLAVVLAEHARRPVRLPERLHALCLHHMRQQSHLAVQDGRIVNADRDVVRLLHLVGMKRSLEDGRQGVIYDYIRSQISDLLGASNRLARMQPPGGHLL